MRRKQFQGYSTEKNCLSKIMEYGQARRNEKNSGGGVGVGAYQLCTIVNHHGWPKKKIFHFKSSNAARKT